MKNSKWITLAVAALAVSACRGGNKTEKTKDGTTIEETGKDVSNNPFGAISQMAQAGKEMAEKQKEMASRKPVDPVKFDVLIPLLPDPKGWTAPDAQGQTTSMGEWKFTNVNRNYSKPGEGGKPQSNIKVEIIDGAYISAIYAPFIMMSKFSNESTDGYEKGVTIDGYPAFEKWQKKSAQSQIQVLVNDRFLVSFEGNQVDPDTLKEWVGRVDMKKLAKM